ncbi:MAG: winged helix DNA-binding domain-containing protein [Acidimicrobiia bacterium]|nr:winged helix DNA-binding domain-containing protein [Acidimicrobiia bacterium]MDX2468881.1 winged helix DNA-binding domain-containing protein [Acidimicrobiia bacterium]
MSDHVDLMRAVDGSVGVYGTAPTCYLSALARIPDFTIGCFNDAVAAGDLVRIRAMRYSVHTVSAELLPTIAAATKSLVRKTNSYRGRAEPFYEKFANDLDAVLAKGPMPAVQIRSLVDPDGELGDLFSVLMGLAASHFQVVRTVTTGTWRSDRFLYARWQDWVHSPPPDEMDEATAMRQLAERYVAAYGPVTVDDVKWWTGWTKTQTLEVADGLDLSLQGTAIGYLEGVRLLPVWDVLMVAYRNRDRLFDPSYSPLTHDRFGNATSVVLDMGRVVGQWDLGSSDDPLSIKVAPFSDWSKRLWNDVRAQADRIGKLIGTDDVEVTEVDEPVDLLDSSRNRFLAPLSKR